MNVNQVVRTISIKATADVDQATAGLSKLAAAQQNVAVVSEQSARRTLSIADAWRKQTLALDEAARSSARAASATKVAESALAEGLISTQQYATRLDLIAQKYGVVTAAAEKFARAQSLATVNTAPAINQRLGVKDDFGTAVRANDIAAYGKQLDDVRAKYNPLFAAGRAYKESLAEINSAAKVDAISEKERAAAVESTKASFVQQVGVLRTFKQSTDDATKSTGLARYEMINLGRQGADVFTQLASGQSLFLIAAQQGPQVLDIFATSQGRFVDALKSGVGWLGRFATSAAGVATGVIGIGAAAIFAAMQFARASTTIEQALEEQNRLLKEGKALLDARTSAEARAQLQSKEQTQFEARRNELDLQVKLNAAMEEAARLAASRAGTPTGGGMPEMGIAPTGIAARSDPGYEKIIEAHAKLKGAQEAGLPGIKEFNAELAKVGLAHPELALIVQDMLKAGEAGLELEKSALRAKALSAALGDVATNAQLAALGLGSIAQIQLNNQQANEAREATERQAIAVLKIRDNWGGVSIEAAKTLDALSQQLSMAQAVGAMAQIEAQHKAKIAELSQRLSESEATRIADYERAISLAQIEAQHKQQMVALQGQLSVAKQVTEVGQINAQYEATVQLLTLQIGQVKAIEQAEAQRAISIAQANASAEQQLKTLQQQGQLLQASSDFDRDRIAAAQTYRNLLEKNVDSDKARAVAAQQLRNADISRQAQETAEAERDAARSAEQHARANQAAAAAAERNAQAAAEAQRRWEQAAQALKFLPFYLLDTLGAMDKLFDSNQGGKSQFNPQGYDSTIKTSAPLTSIGAGATYQDAFSAYSNMLAGGLTKASTGLSASFGGGSAIDTEKLSTLERLISVMPRDQQISATQNLLEELNQKTPSLERDEAINKLTQSLEQLRNATDANTAATSAMTDVLSPLYSTDSRQTRQGFRSFAGGGIMSPWGEIPINRYAGGGVASSPQVSIFGEGSTPEAYVPVPNGRIPVEMSQPANSNAPPQINFTQHLHFAGPVTPEMVEMAKKKTGFQVRQELRRLASG